MNPTSTNVYLRYFNRLFPTGMVVLLILLAATTVTGLRIKNSTGKLTITTFAKDATISISQDSHETKIVGVGSTKLRLAPGTYEITASSGGYSAISHVTIAAQKDSNVYVSNKQPPPLPSSDNITFSGIDSLVNRGITSAQAGRLRRLFFKYNEQAKTINIDVNSVERGPRIPDSGAPFSLNFTGTIDSKSYKATITYTDLDALELTIYSPTTGNQLFTMSSTDLTLSF